MKEVMEQDEAKRDWLLAGLVSQYPNVVDNMTTKDSLTYAQLKLRLHSMSSNVSTPAPGWLSIPISSIVGAIALVFVSRGPLVLPTCVLQINILLIQIIVLIRNLLIRTTLVFAHGAVPGVSTAIIMSGRNAENCEMQMRLRMQMPTLATRHLASSNLHLTLRPLLMLWKRSRYRYDYERGYGSQGAKV